MHEGSPIGCAYGFAHGVSVHIGYSNAVIAVSGTIIIVKFTS